MTKYFLPLILFASLLACAQTTLVTGDMKNPDGTAAAGSAVTFAKFDLQYAGANQCRVSGTGQIVQTSYKVQPNASGHLSVNLYSNSSITCGTTLGNTRWNVTYYVNNVPGQSCAYNITGPTWDLNTQICVTVAPVVTAPTGDTTYAQLSGGNMPFTGKIIAPAYNGRCNVESNSGTNFGLKFSGTWADSGCTASLFNGQNLYGSQSLSANITGVPEFSRTLFGNATLTMGSYSLQVANKGVALEGLGAWGTSGSSGAAGGTYLDYSGTAEAVKVGSAAADTFFFRANDLGIHPTGAGAIGIGMYRTYMTDLQRLRIACSVSNTATGLLSDGTGSYSAFNRFDKIYLNNCKTGLKLTGGSNANLIGNSSLSGPSAAAGSIGINIDNGDALLLWPDLEAWETGLRVNSNYSAGFLRFDGGGLNTNDITFTSNAHYNFFIVNKANPIITDPNGDNSVYNPTKIQFKADGGMRFANALDQTLTIDMRAGSATDHLISFLLRDKNGTGQMSFGKSDTNNAYMVHDEIAGFTRTEIVPNGYTAFDSKGTFDFNSRVGASTQGLRFFSGGVLPAVVATIDGAGKGTFNGGIAIGTSVAQGSGLKHQRITTGSIAASSSAAITVTWTNAFADGNYTPTCSVEDATTSTSTLRVHHIEAVGPSAIVVRVVNDDAGGAHTGAVACIAMHD